MLYLWLKWQSGNTVFVLFNNTNYVNKSLILICPENFKLRFCVKDVKLSLISFLGHCSRPRQFKTVSRKLKHHPLNWVWWRKKTRKIIFITLVDLFGCHQFIFSPVNSCNFVSSSILLLFYRLCLGWVRAGKLFWLP